MKLLVYVRGLFINCWLDRHCKWYAEKLAREADEYFELEMAVAAQDTSWEAEPSDPWFRRHENNNVRDFEKDAR